MNYVLTNWKTSVMGLTALIPGAVQLLAGTAALFHIAIPGVTVTDDPMTMIGHGFAALSAGLPVVLLGLAAKDADVTGGAREAPPPPKS